MHHSRRFARPGVVILAATFCLVLVGLILRPGAAFADDCLTDPFNAEDCLRTLGFAPLLGGAVTSLTALITTMREVANTLTARAGSAVGASGQAPAWPFQKLEETFEDIKRRTGGDARTPEEIQQQQKETAEKITWADRAWRVIVGVGAGALAAVALVKVPLVALGVFAITALTYIFAPDVFTPLYEWFTRPSKK